MLLRTVNNAMPTNNESIQNLNDYSKDIVIYALVMANIIIRGIEQGKIFEWYSKYLKVLYIPIPSGIGRITCPIFDLSVANDITSGCGNFKSAVYEARKIEIDEKEYDSEFEEELLKIYQTAIEDGGYVGNIPKEY